MPRKPRKPTVKRQQPRNARGQFQSASDAALAKQYGEPKAFKRPAKVDAFLDRAFATRKQKDFEKTRRAVGVRKGTRDVPVKTQAKLEARTIKHRTFRTPKAAKRWLSTQGADNVTWFGVSSRDDEDETLFSYQSPAGDVEDTLMELDNAENPPHGRSKTDFKVRTAVQSSDARITVHVLPISPTTKATENASKQPKRMGNKKGSRKPAKRGQNGSGAAAATAWAAAMPELFAQRLTVENLPALPSKELAKATGLLLAEMRRREAVRLAEARGQSDLARYFR